MGSQPVDRPSRDATAPVGESVPFREALRVWLRIGFSSFGGPAGQIALMHRVLVEEKRWIGEQRFLHALNYCMLLPGPEAQQLATYVGWLLHRARGGLVAGTLFVLPGALAVFALSWLYVEARDLRWVAGIFLGLKAAVIAIVIEALLRIGKRALRGGAHVALAVASFVSIFFLDLSFPLVVLGALAIGLAAPRWFAVGGGHAPKGSGALIDALLDDRALTHVEPSLRRAARTLAIGLVLWFAPVALVALLWGGEGTLARLGLFFSQAAVVTFGGAYAVLAFVAQAAVDDYGWLSTREMVDGLGLAETTPGPLILVTQFVGFVAGHHHPGTLSPLAAAALGAALTTWVTFVPCFLWIFLGAPYVERLRERRELAAALAAVTSAAVGTIASLAAWFALHALFADVGWRGLGFARWPAVAWTSIDVRALALAIVASIALFRLRWGVLPTLGVCALGGLAILALERG